MICGRARRECGLRARDCASRSCCWNLVRSTPTSRCSAMTARLRAAGAPRRIWRPRRRRRRSGRRWLLRGRPCTRSRMCVALRARRGRCATAATVAFLTTFFFVYGGSVAQAPTDIIAASALGCANRCGRVSIFLAPQVLALHWTHLRCLARPLSVVRSWARRRCWGRRSRYQTC